MDLKAVVLRQRNYDSIRSWIMGSSLTRTQVEVLKDLLEKCVDPETEPLVPAVPDTKVGK